MTQDLQCQIEIIVHEFVSTLRDHGLSGEDAVIAIQQALKEYEA